MRGKKPRMDADPLLTISDLEHLFASIGFSLQLIDCQGIEEREACEYRAGESIQEAVRRSHTRAGQHLAPLKPCCGSGSGWIRIFLCFPRSGSIEVKTV